MGIVIGVIIFCIFIFGVGFLIYTYSDVDLNFKTKSIELTLKEKELYQGPVPEGYDEDHFRKTGETIKNG